MMAQAEREEVDSASAPTEPASNNPPRGRRLEVWIALGIFLVVNVAGALWQKTISANGGKSWESASYYRVAEEFAQGKRIASEGPTVYRVGAPFLAAMVGRGDLFRGFRIVNFTANLLTVVLLVSWLRLQLDDWRVRAVLVAMFVLQWDAPVRWLWFEPVHTDPWAWVFLLGGLIAVHHAGRGGTRERWWLAALCVVSVVGVLFREIVLMVPLALVFARRPITKVDGVWVTWRSMRWPPVVFFLPLALGIVALVVVRRSVTATSDLSFMWDAQHLAYNKPLPEILLAWLLAFGPLLFLVVFDWRRGGRFLAGEQSLLVYLVAFAVLGYIGGTDSERLTYWTMPVVYVLIGRALEAHGAVLRSVPLIGMMASCQLLAERAFMLTPDYPNRHPARSLPLFTPGLGDHFSYLDLFSFFGSRPVELISLAEYGVFAVVLWEWLAYRRRKLEQPVGRPSGEPETFLACKTPQP